MFLENTRMGIIVDKKVVLGGRTFHPRDKVVAQATDSGRMTWNVGCMPGGSVCTVNKDELEQRRAEHAINFEWPAK